MEIIETLQEEQRVKPVVKILQRPKNTTQRTGCNNECTYPHSRETKAAEGQEPLQEFQVCEDGGIDYCYDYTGSGSESNVTFPLLCGHSNPVAPEV